MVSTTVTPMTNLDAGVVRGFGDEWTRFDQSGLPPEEHRRVFDLYFNVFPWSELPPKAEGFDLGCGSGRWAQLAAPRVGKLHCIDASEEALAVAKKKLSSLPNVAFHHASVDAIPLADGSMDFGYSLGVLHHVPDTRAGIEACARKLKRGAPFLLYLYYRFDNRPWWFRRLWDVADVGRAVICRMPYPARSAISQAIALTVYVPLARTARALDRVGVDAENFPMWAYRDSSFYAMRTDALDRFGTRLSQRFTRKEIREMMEAAGLERIRFSDELPYWCAVGYRR
jgi:ubiquinone/menaquinone biosynthesis C-methylase UbiE